MWKQNCASAESSWMYSDSMFSIIINIPISVSFLLKMTRPLITLMIILAVTILYGCNEDASTLYGIMVILEEWLGEFYVRHTMDDSDLSKSSLGIDGFPTYWWRSRWSPKSLTVRLDGFSDQRIVPLLKPFIFSVTIVIDVRDLDMLKAILASPSLSPW